MSLTTTDLYEGALRAAATTHLRPETVEHLSFDTDTKSARGTVDGVDISVGLPQDPDSLMGFVAEFVNTREGGSRTKSVKPTAKASKAADETAKDTPSEEPVDDTGKTDSATQSVARAKKNATAKIPVDPNDDF